MNTVSTSEPFRMATKSIELIQVVVEDSCHLTLHKALLRFLPKALNQIMMLEEQGAEKMLHTVRML